LTALSNAVGGFAAATGRHIHLVLENDDNCATLLAPQEDPPDGHYRAQWNDDYHHAWHALLTREEQGYYRDYRDVESHVTRTLADGFAYQGEASSHRQGAPRGEPSRDLPRTAFVDFIQNHDQIGNRPLGERLATLAKPEAVQAALAVLLLQPSPPLLFMGEEWGATEPFPFFCDFTGELADAVRNGRKKEFADAYAKHGGNILDPLAAETFAAAKLDWSALNRPAHAGHLALVRTLLAARREYVLPLVPAMTRAGDATFIADVLNASWKAGDKALLILANLSDDWAACPDIPWGTPMWGGTPSPQLRPWSVYAAIGDS
jgi:malto-oligosyltrehalose trehalohydrolase